MKWNGEEVVVAVIRDISDRKKAEEERFETASRFLGFAQASQYGMSMADLKGHIVYANPTLVTMLGEKSLNDCMGKNFPSTYYPPHLSQKINEEVIPTLLDEGSWQGELELLTIDGRSIPTDENYFVILDQDGNPRFYADILTDITERKKAENALLDNERKLHAIFDHHFQLTGLIDTNGRLLAANRTALLFAGIEESEALGQLFWDGPWWTSEQKQEVKSAFERACKGEFIRFETTHPTPSGEIRNIDFSFNPVKDDNGEVLYVVPEGRDISLMRQTEARLRNLSDNIPGGMTYQLDMGKDGQMRQFTYVSAGVEKIHELTVDEVLRDAGLLYGQIFEEDLPELAAREAKALEEFKPFVAEARMKLPSGAIHWHLLTSAPRRAPNGHIIWDGIEIDITERKQAEVELEKYRNHLESMVNRRTQELEIALKHLKEAQAQLVQSEKMASLGVLTAGIAHEINNPLNFIMGSFLGFEDIFKEQVKTDPKINMLLNSLKTGIDRSAKIVKGLNEFSRMQDRSDELCDIPAIIDNCLMMLKNKLEDRIEIVTNYTSDQLQCTGNVGKLHQVFLNILANAIQAIEGKGRITIHSKKNKDTVQIEISDTGCGISDDNLSKILDPFFTTKDPGQGTGLGLSISYTIINEHNGTLDFHSEKNRGTNAIITLPSN